jgi:hypothetical protein
MTKRGYCAGSSRDGIHIRRCICELSVLQGAATPERFTKLKRYFRTLPLLNPTHPIEAWEAAAELYLRCRRRGYTPRSPHACLVARIALEHRTPLLHDDRDFELIAKVERRLKLLPLA